MPRPDRACLRRASADCAVGQRSADFVPLALRDLVRLARDAPARRPSISYPVCAARVTVDQHREELFGVQSIQDAAQFFKSVVGPVLVLSITRGAAITLMRI